MWQDWDFVNSLGPKKKLSYLEDLEDWLPKFIRKFYGKIYCICDSDKNLEGKKFFNIKIVHKSKLLHRKDLFLLLHQDLLDQSHLSCLAIEKNQM